jgi:hypothetical protein
LNSPKIAFGYYKFTGYQQNHLTTQTFKVFLLFFTDFAQDLNALIPELFLIHQDHSNNLFSVIQLIPDDFCLQNLAK